MEFVNRGDRVSLNPSKRAYYFQGKDGINLNIAGNKTEILSKDISNDALKKINMAIKLEYLVKGWPPGEKIVIPEDNNIGDILQKGRNKIKDFIYELRRKSGLSGEKKIAKLEKLLELEKADKNRVSVVSELEKSLSTLAGISPIIEEEEEKKEKVEIQLTKGTEEA